MSYLAIENSFISVIKGVKGIVITLIRGKKGLGKKYPVYLMVILLVVSSVLVPLTVKSSAGNIFINSTSSSVPGQEITAGDNVSLYFGEVVWFGAEFSLYLSSDSSNQLNPGDSVYTPVFSWDNLTASSQTLYESRGTWTVGENWVNGTIPKDFAGGDYFIKAYDGNASSVAVTDTYLTIAPVLSIDPSGGPGGGKVLLQGYSYPSSSLVYVYYYDSVLLGWQVWQSLYTDNIGQFAISSAMPDSGKVGLAGDNPTSFSTLSFGAVGTNSLWAYVDYKEYFRGLKQVENQVADGLFGNETDLTSDVGLEVGDSCVISGKWFHPGIAYLYWDNVINVGVVSSDQTGSFETVINIPETSLGVHSIWIIDGYGDVGGGSGPTVTCSFMVYVSVIEWANVTENTGDLVIDGNNTVLIENSKFIQTGNIYLLENCSLILRNSKLIMNQTRNIQFRIDARDNSLISCFNTSISSNYAFYNFFYNNTMVNFTRTMWKNGTYTIHDSTQTLNVVESLGLGSFSILTSGVFLNCYGTDLYTSSIRPRSEYTNLEVISCAIPTVYVRVVDSIMDEVGLEGDYIGYFNAISNLTFTGTVSPITIIDSNTHLSFDLYSSNASFVDCDLFSLTAYTNSNLSFSGCSFTSFTASNSSVIGLFSTFVGFSSSSDASVTLTGIVASGVMTIQQNSTVVINDSIIANVLQEIMLVCC